MDSLPPRNNTNYPQSVVEAIRSLDVKDKYTREPQVIVRDFVAKNPRSRGLLVYHIMGAGKTWTSVSLAETLKGQYRIIFIASKSLHENMRKEIKKFLRATVNPEVSDTEVDEHIAKYYSFVSTKNRATVRKALEAASLGVGDEGKGPFGEEEQVGTLDNTVLIIDEAHNMFYGIINGSKSDMALYDLIMGS